MSKRQLLLLSASPSAQADWHSALQSHFDLVQMTSAAAALDQLKKALPAAIIMDHSLSDYKTPAFIDKIRNSAVSRNLPFIIVSRETSNLAIEQCVRAGVSHYIGMPFEPEVLIEKIRSALSSEVGRSSGLYFRIDQQIETQAISFGRIAYVDEHGLHFETNLILSPGEKLLISGPVFEAMNLDAVEIEVENTSRDVYYNYPLAVDAKWSLSTMSDKLRGWVIVHKNINSPKKKKILFVEPDNATVTNLSSKLDSSRYSLRVVASLNEALESLPYMKPSCFIVSAEVWAAGKDERLKILKTLSEMGAEFVFYGSQIEGPANFMPAKKMETPKSIDALALAIRKVSPPFEPEAGRIYFSKSIDYSRCNFLIPAKTIVLGELGIRLALSKEISAPCNLRLSLKTFSEQELRNPFVRAWPPLLPTAKTDSSDGKYPFCAETHFLGITDPQGQAIRLWIRDLEMKEKRDELYKPPQKS